MVWLEISCCLGRLTTTKQTVYQVTYQQIPVHALEDAAVGGM